MKVFELIDLLKSVDKNAFIVVDDIIVSGVIQEKGRFKTGHYNDGWLSLEKGNAVAVRFTKNDELSDGSLTVRIV